MTATMVFIHIMSLFCVGRLVFLMADWSCTPDTAFERRQRGLVIVALLMPITLAFLFANIAPYFMEWTPGTP